MKSLFLDRQFPYDGTQLRSLYNYLDHGLLGDSLVAWVGPCHVTFDHMVDGEDLRAQAKIEGSKMVHFLIELFDRNLFSGVSVQRLIASIACDFLREQSSTDFSRGLRREGDDIFSGNRKLSISIATVSPVSTLIHFAVNVSNEGTPVPTLSLEDLGIDSNVFVESIVQKVCEEIESIREATQKVKWVR